METNRKNWKKTLAIAATLVLVAGVIIAALVLLLGTPVSVAQVERSDAFSPDCREIRMETDVCNVQLAPTQGEQITVEFRGREQTDYAAAVTDGVLLIRAKRPWISLLHLSWHTDDAIRVGIPAGYAGALTLQNTTGDAVLTDLPDCKAVAITATTGGVTVQNVAADALSAHVTTGDLTLTEVCVAGDVSCEATTGRMQLSRVTCQGLEGDVTTGNAAFTEVQAKTMRVTGTTADLSLRQVQTAGDLTVENTTGHTELTEVTVQGTLRRTGQTGSLTGGKLVCTGLDCEGTTGDITLAGVQCDVLRMKATTGDVTLTEVQSGSQTDLHTTTGDIRCGFTDAISNYTIHCSHGSGSVNLPESLALGDKRLDVSVTTGDANVTFAK